MPKTPIARKSTKRKFISFFSGALGLDIGLHKGGLHTLAINEFDSVACRTIRANLKRIYGSHVPRLYECDIRTLTPESLCRDLRIGEGELFAVVGGPPCQAFSTAGRRLGLSDDRGNVFLHFIDIITGMRPKYAIFENVRGLLSVPLIHRPHSERGRGFAPLTEEENPRGALLHILRRLERAGYRTTFNLYNTANFGVPQIRERIIFFASRDGQSVPHMIPTHDETGENGLPRWRTFREVVSGLDPKKYEAGKFLRSGFATIECSRRDRTGAIYRKRCSRKRWEPVGLPEVARQVSTVVLLGTSLRRLW